MASRVNLNLPPQLVESARAAQFANREVLEARSRGTQIKAKVKQRKEAEERANPLQTRQREGGLLEFRREPTQRIWRRPRVRGEVDLGLVLKRQYRTQTVEYFPYGNPLSRRITTKVNVCYGTQDRAKWSPVIEFEDFLQENYYPFFQSSLLRIYQKAFATLELILPMGGDSMLIVLIRMANTQTAKYVDFSLLSGLVWTSSDNVYTFRAFLVTPTSIEERDIGRPAFLLQFLPVEFYPAADGAVDFFPEYRHAKSYGLGWMQHKNPITDVGVSNVIPIASSPVFAVGNYRSLGNGVTSNCYEGFFNSFSGTYQELAAKYAAKFKERTGRDQPDTLNAEVFSSNPSDPVVKPDLFTNPNTLTVKYGTFSTNDLPFLQIPSAPLTLEDSKEQTLPGNAEPPILYVGATYETYVAFEGALPNVYSQNTFDNIIIAYDMHGGTYCRDQIAALDITL